MMEQMNVGQGRNTCKNRADRVSISFIKGRGGEGSLTFTIGANIASKAGLKDGDRVSVFWDKQDLCGMIQKTVEGIKIRQKGSIGTMVFSFCRQKDHPRPKKMVNLQAVTVNNDKEIMFEFPRSSLPAEFKEVCPTPMELRDEKEFDAYDHAASNIIEEAKPKTFPCTKDPYPYSEEEQEEVQEYRFTTNTFNK
jgi:hypothetical protein